MKNFAIVLIALTLSSCALLDKIRSDRLDVETPPVVEDIRG